MSEWRISVPHRDRSDTIADVFDSAPEVLDSEAAAVTRNIALAALARGVTTAGALIDELESAGTEGRRQILDQAREEAGLESASALEAEERVAANRRAARARQADLESRPPDRQRYVTPTGLYVDPVEVEREAAREAKARAAIEERRAERDRLAAERAAAERASGERVALELPPGYPR